MRCYGKIVVGPCPLSEPSPPPNFRETRAYVNEKSEAGVLHTHDRLLWIRDSVEADETSAGDWKPGLGQDRRRIQHQKETQAPCPFGVQLALWHHREVRDAPACALRGERRCGHCAARAGPFALSHWGGNSPPHGTRQTALRSRQCPLPGNRRQGRTATCSTYYPKYQGSVPGDVRRLTAVICGVKRKAGTPPPASGSLTGCESLHGKAGGGCPSSQHRCKPPNPRGHLTGPSQVSYGRYWHLLGIHSFTRQPRALQDSPKC